MDIDSFSYWDRKAREYGIGQYRSVPKRKHGASNSARIGIVKRKKKQKKQSQVKVKIEDYLV